MIKREIDYSLLYKTLENVSDFQVSARWQKTLGSKSNPGTKSPSFIYFNDRPHLYEYPDVRYYTNFRVERFLFDGQNVSFSVHRTDDKIAMFLDRVAVFNGSFGYKCFCLLNDKYYHRCIASHIQEHIKT